jgi:hypothetical protein
MRRLTPESTEIKTPGLSGVIRGGDRNPMECLLRSD